MPRQKKDARILYIKLDRQLYELLEGHAEATGDTKTGLVEKILSEYLLKLRLDEAVRLLLTTDQTITEIAEQSGFPNLKSLNQSFRAKYGASPKEYRQSKASVSAVIPRPPASNVLQDVNQLLRPYRLVYRKNEEAVRVADIIETGNGTPLSPHWDILNVDNCFECLQTSVQESLAQIQSHLHFRYVRLCNCLGYEMTP